MTRSSAPPRVASLVGRQAELVRIRELFGSDVRLITIVGPPGIGKTRLAAELFHEEANRAETRDPRIAWVQLATARAREEVCARVGQELGIRMSWREPADFITELGWALESRGETHLFLDEAEGCVSAVSEVLERWLSLAPDARAVVTSRERLGIPGELAVELFPLESGGEQDALKSDAGRLLLARAGLSEPTDPAAAESMSRLLTALEGIPLAIELAAARLHLLGADELLTRWPKQLDVLSTRGPDERTTLRGALESSWNPLSKKEKHAFACCSLFAASFTVEAAENVIGTPDALEQLHALRDKSLIARDSLETAARLRLYGAVRAFGAEQLDAIAPDAKKRYAAYFAALAKTATEKLEHEDEPAALRTLTQELDDLRRVFELLGGIDRELVALGIAAALRTRGPPIEAVRSIDEVWETASKTTKASLAMARGHANEVIGNLDDAIASFRAALESESDARRADAWAAIAGAELARGDFDASQRATAEAIAAAPAGTRAHVEARRRVGLLAHARGQLEDAVAAYDEARQGALDLGLAHRAAQLRADIGTVRLQQRRLEEAREHVEAAIEDLDPETDPVAVALAEGNLAILLQELGQLERAETLFAAGIARLQKTGHQLYTAHLLAYAGALAHERGRIGAAIEHYDAAMLSLRRIGDARLLAVVASMLGAAESSRDRIEAAEEAFRVAEQAREKIDDPGVKRAMAIHLLHLELARARQQRDDSAVDKTRSELGQKVAELKSDEAVTRSDDARLALRLLEGALGHGALGVDEVAKELHLPDGSRIDFSKRAVLWRILHSLLGRRRDAPGTPLNFDALLEAGWPGEQPTGHSGLNRVKVSLSNLRKLGLRDLLLREEGGYFLDPSIPLRWG